MRKLRSDARWHGFSAAQQEQIQQWLFVEHLSYATVHERMRAELGIACALSTIGPLYHYLKESRSQVKEAMLQKLTEVITEPGTDLAAVKADSLQVITNRLLVRSEFSKRNGEFVKLSQVMARGDACDVARERLELRRDMLAFRRVQAMLKCALGGAKGGESCGNAAERETPKGSGIR